MIHDVKSTPRMIHSLNVVVESSFSSLVVVDEIGMFVSGLMSLDATYAQCTHKDATMDDDSNTECSFVGDSCRSLL